MDYDVIVIGGGPGGSAIGSYLGKAGVKTLLIESAIHPRPHVGESMVTATTRVFKEIGFLQTMEDEGFVRKYGASWHTFLRKGEFAIEFGEFPQDGIEQDYTYHVDRAKFDLLMLKHAEKLGTKVIQGAAVQEVLMENGQACGVRMDVAGQTVEVRSKVVVDASGRRSIIGRQLGLLKKDPIFDQYAVHAWFKNVKRDQKTADFIHIHFLKVERGWAWQIPITEEITSIGVVTEKAVFQKSGMDIGKWFETHVDGNPDLKACLEGSERVNEFTREADYSYCMDAFTGNGWALIGDAARFVDPIFSSGVSVAMYGAKVASEAIVAGLAKGDVSRDALIGYETRMRAGVAIWYEFIRLYYKLLPMFTHFIASKEHRMGVLRLLQGEVYDRTEVPVLDAMRKFIKEVEASDNHLFKGALTNMPID